MATQTKSKDELASLVAEAIETAVNESRAVPTPVEEHIRDGMGRNWDVLTPAPTPHP